MNARSVRRPAIERVIIDRADPRLLRSVRQVALAGLALVLVWPAAVSYTHLTLPTTPYV